MKERKAFDVAALYIVNHQRYLPPDERDNPPFKKNQIEDAEHDERGLLTTYDLFNLYFNIQNGFVTQDDARAALSGYGVVSFPPSNSVERISDEIELHHAGSVVVLRLNGNGVKVGASVILEHGGRYSAARVVKLQLEDSNVEEASCGEVGMRLSEPYTKGGSIWLLDEGAELSGDELVIVKT